MQLTLPHSKPSSPTRKRLELTLLGAPYLCRLTCVWQVGGWVVRALEGVAMGKLR